MALSKGPGEEPNELKEQDYYSQFLGVNKPPDDAKYEPELRNLLAKLYERQRDERHDLLEQQNEALEQVQYYRRIGDPDLREEFRVHFDDDAIAGKHHHEMVTQQDRFAEERERYITDYQKAQTIRDEMQRQSREQALEQGLDDKPKLSY